MEQILTVVASVVTVAAFAYVLFFGSKTLPELLTSRIRGYLSRRPRANEVLTTVSTRLTAVSVSANGDSCAYGGFDKTLNVISMTTRKKHLFALHSETIRHIIHLPISDTILSAADDGCVYATDMSLALHKLIGKCDSPVYVLYHHVLSNRVITGDRSGHIYSWDQDHSPWQRIGESIKHSDHAPDDLAKYKHGSIFAICGKQDSSLIYYSGVGGKVYSYTFLSNRTLKVADLSQTVFCLVYDEPGDTLYAACADGIIRCLCLTTMSLSTLEGHTDAVRWLLLDGTRRQLFSSSKDKSIRRWNLHSGIRSIVGSHNDYVYHLAISPNGNDIFSAGGDGQLILWHLK